MNCQFRRIYLKLPVVEPVQPDAFGPELVGDPFGPPPSIVGCKTCRKFEIGQSLGYPISSKCGKSTENSKMTRSPALVARFLLIGIKYSRDLKWSHLIGSCIVEGAVIGTLHNWKFNASEIRFFAERIDNMRNRPCCCRVPSINLNRFSDCYRYCM